MTTTSSDITDEQRLAMLKHLNAGKTLDQVATITRRDRALVLDVVSKHGYPHSLKKGIEALTAKIDRDRGALPEATKTPVGAASTPAPTGLPTGPRPATTSPSLVTTTDVRPVGAPDEIRVLLNTGKNHPSKRIQKAADRVLDTIGRLRDLIAEDEAKHAERRQAEQARTAARAEVERLERQLAAAKAKLRGPKPTSTTLEVGDQVSAAELRAWAKSRGIEVPAAGRVPARIREQYEAENTEPQDGAA